MRRGLHEKFRTLGRVDAIVEIAATRGFGFFHARVAAAKVSHARSPDFLAADGRLDFSFGERCNRCEFVKRRFKKIG